LIFSGFTSNSGSLQISDRFERKKEKMVDFTTVCMVLLDLQFDLLCDLENTLANSYLGTFDYGGEKNEK